MEETISIAEINKLSSILSQYNKTYLHLKKLYELFETVDDKIKDIINLPSGQAAFIKVVKELEQKGILAPVKNSGVNNHGLYLKYRVIPVKQNYEDVKKQIIQQLKKPLKVDYYLTYPAEFLKSKEYIEIIADFIENGVSDIISINERSYQLFGDEKFLKGVETSEISGERILNNLGLNWNDLGCYLTYEPFFCFFSEDYKSKTGRKVYIIENKDSFWSFKKLLFEGGAPPGADMVIYGEGNKILSSFRFVEEYGLNTSDNFIYFGDLDPEGINIFIELKNKYPQYQITPHIDAYQRLIRLTRQKELKKTRKNQRINLEYIDQFGDFFQVDYQNSIKSILMNGFYIPQEALSLTLLKQYYDTTP
jgi:hypothetical protein